MTDPQKPSTPHTEPPARWVTRPPGMLEAVISTVTDYAILTLDPRGHVTSWNAGAERIKGYTGPEALGMHFSRFYPEDAIRRAWPEYELETARKTGRFEDEGWRIRKDGSRFWANIVITALRDPVEGVIGFLKITRDLSERKHADERLRQSEERFRLLADGVIDYAIFMLDTSGRVMTWNRGAERVKGYRADEIIGAHFSRFYTPDAIEERWPDHELQETIRTGRFECESWRVRKDGSRFWANVVLTAVHDRAGHLRGIAKVTRDLTERRASEEQLRQAHADLEARVIQRTAELAHANQTLTAEIAERHRLEQELRQRVGQLRDADRTKNEFLAVLAHELRNPLAPIRNGIEFLRMGGSSDPQTQRAQQIVARQVGQMTRLVDDLLDVSRISRNVLTLRPERVDMMSVVRDAVDTSRPLIDANAHELILDLPDAAVPADADAARLSQVIANLLNNAAKFTPRGGRIWLTLQTVGNMVEARVRDNGIGVRAEALPRLFDMFYQPTQGEQPQSGLGIGLTLSKRLVELHGGTLEAHSAGEGRGSEFVVRIPAGMAAAAEHNGPVPERDAEPLPMRRIIIVDDNRDSVESLRMVLSMMGNDIRVGHDGVDAVTLAHEFKPEIALIDLGMPRMNGYEAARRIRRQPWGKSIKLVALTGWGQEEDRRRARDAGFDLHLTKPVDPAALRELLSPPESASQP